MLRKLFNQPGPGIAASASLIRVQTFMLTTTATISSISSGLKCSASASWKRWNAASRSVSAAGEGLGVAERRLLGLGVKLGLPPRGQGVDLDPGDARLARRLVVQVEAVGAVVELRDPQPQELGEAAVDPQVRRVPERIRAHPGHADQRLVPARVEPAVRDLDIVSHLGSFRCSSFPAGAPSEPLACDLLSLHARGGDRERPLEGIPPIGPSAAKVSESHAPDDDRARDDRGDRRRQDSDVDRVVG
jgi:hypothetical protein